METQFEGLEVRTGESVCAVTLKYIKVGRVKGRNILRRAGFAQCPNPNYMQRGKGYARYNSLNGIWVFD